jgi:hypothetical protein
LRARPIGAKGLAEVNMITQRSTRAACATCAAALLLPVVLSTSFGCATKDTPTPTPPTTTTPATATSTAQRPAAPPPDLASLPRLQFNRRAAEEALPLFWIDDRNGDGTLQPDELAVLWGVSSLPASTWRQGGAFTPAFFDAYRMLATPPDWSALPEAERVRRETVRAELAQGRPTLVATRPDNENDRALIAALLQVAEIVERLHARQLGTAELLASVPADDHVSKALFFRNQGPFCQAPKTESDPACGALLPLPPKRFGFYPASIQADPQFCEVLAKRKDADTLLSQFTVVRHKEGGRAEGAAATDDLVAVPYTSAWPMDMAAAAQALQKAAALIATDDEAALKRYLLAAAAAFQDNNWFAADTAWAAMNADNSKWYLRVGPDEVYTDPCARKANFHVSFARMNQESKAWQQKLDPVKQDMEAALAKLAGRPYQERKVGFQLPEFIDIVVNAGDSRNALGATIGQSLPNWGPVADAGGRTVAMTNLYTDKDSRDALAALAGSMFCQETAQKLDMDPRHGTLSTVLHEAAHNLGPAHEYKVKGKTDDQVFGGPLASTLEELKAQTAALYFADWLVDRKLLSAEDADKSRIRDVTWALGHIANGMFTADNKPKPYSQLAAIQMGFLLKKGVLVWRAEEPAQNGADIGCLEVEVAKWRPAVAELARVVVGIKGRGDKAGAEMLVKEHVTGGGPFATLRATTAERWLRAPKASFVYSVEQ